LKKKMHFQITPRHLRQECNGICNTHKLSVCLIVVSKLAPPVLEV
jgi:hypothetical protein